MLTRGTVGLILGLLFIIVAVVWKLVATRLVPRLMDRAGASQKQPESLSELQEGTYDQD